MVHSWPHCPASKGALLKQMSMRPTGLPHPWDEPFERITAASSNENYRLLTPQIGEPVELANEQNERGLNDDI